MGIEQRWRQQRHTGPFRRLTGAAQHYPGAERPHVSYHRRHKRDKGTCLDAQLRHQRRARRDKRRSVCNLQPAELRQHERAEHHHRCQQRRPRHHQADMRLLLRREAAHHRAGLSEPACQPQPDKHSHRGNQQRGYRDDPTLPGGNEFRKWLAECDAKGEPVEWDDIL